MGNRSRLFRFGDERGNRSFLTAIDGEGHRRRRVVLARFVGPDGLFDEGSHDVLFLSYFPRTFCPGGSESSEERRVLFVSWEGIVVVVVVRGGYIEVSVDRFPVLVVLLAGMKGRVQVALYFIVRRGRQILVFARRYQCRDVVVRLVAAAAVSVGLRWRSVVEGRGGRDSQRLGRRRGEGRWLVRLRRIVGGFVVLLT